MNSTGALPHDLSAWGMFLAADIVVKAVMGILAAAALFVWLAALAKRIEIAREKRAVKRSMTALSYLGNPSTGSAALNRIPAALRNEAVDEMNRLPAGGDGEAAKARIALRLQRVEAQAARELGSGLGLIATVGAIGPFVGLFGTVWGIMNSFVGIAKTQTTNLAVVAPGIAEALLATAIGLVAAIPAVIFYNMLTRAVGAYKATLADASALVMLAASRAIDAGDVPRVQPQPQKEAA